MMARRITNKELNRLHEYLKQGNSFTKAFYLAVDANATEDDLTDAQWEIIAEWLNDLEEEDYDD